jgi:hypothetical protein
LVTRRQEGRDDPSVRWRARRASSTQKCDVPFGAAGEVVSHRFEIEL